MKLTRPVFLAALPVAITLSAPLSVLAEEQKPIIVTATRTAQTVDDSLASVTVITQEQIEQQQANDLLTLLNSISGIDMTNNGGMGKVTGMFMRGTSSSHVLVLIDGVKVGSATNGDTPFQYIPVSQIERIEIVRGPRSSLYGSEAIGGVIQIFTKKGHGKEEAHFEMGYGTYTTNKLSAGFSLKDGNTSYSLNASHLKTAGFDAVRDTETDNDGYDNNSVTFNIAHKLSKTSSLQVNVMRASGSNEYDGDNLYSNNDSYQLQTTGVQYSFKPLTNWDIKLSTSQSEDNSDSFKDSTFQYRYNTTRTNYSWQNDINIGTSQLLTLGVDYQNDAVNSTTSYAETNRDNSAAYIQHQWTGESNDLLAAIRNDNNQAFGTHTTGNISWGHIFNDEYKLIISHGTAFKAPTFNELYYPGGGNSNLEPEDSSSSEVELRSHHAWGNLSLSAYHTQINNLISGWPANNVNKAEIKGIELRLRTKFAGWDTQAELALLDPRDKDTNNILQRRSQETLRVDMDKTSGQWSSGISFIGQGYRYDDVANTKKINGYGIINLRASYAVSKKMSIKWKIENLLDKEYETALTYNNPGLSGYVSVVYQNF